MKEKRKVSVSELREWSEWNTEAGRLNALGLKNVFDANRRVLDGILEYVVETNDVGQHTLYIVDRTMQGRVCSLKFLKNSPSRRIADIAARIESLAVSETERLYTEALPSPDELI